jgi:hypothetical protein
MPEPSLELACCRAITAAQMRQNEQSILALLNRHDISISDMRWYRSEHEDMIRGTLRQNLIPEDIKLIGETIFTEFGGAFRLVLIDRAGQEIFCREPSS